MSWNNINLLWLLLLTPLVGVVLYLAHRKIQKRVGLLWGFSEASKARVLRPQRTVTGLALLSFVLLIVAAAGPRWGWKWVESKQRGLDIMIAVDVSRSMDATDLSPSRLERAKRLVMDLLDVSEGDRIGLVAFAGTSFVQCPLTSDKNAIRMFLDVINTDLIPVQGTDLADALQTANRSLTAGGEGQGKLLLILTDGEDHDDQKALGEAIQEVVKSGIRVFTIGMGTKDGGPILESNGRFKSDASGQLVVTRLQEENLKLVSSETGGAYFPVTDSAARMDVLYRSGMRRAGTEQEIRTSRQRVWFERYQWVAGLALLILLWEGYLRYGRRLLMLLVVGLFCVGLHATGAAAMSVEELFQRGVQASAEGKWDQAEEAFSKVAEQSTGRGVKQRSFYNLGVVKSQKKDFQGATKAFESALSLDPQDQQARDNLQWTKQQKQQQEEKNKENKKDEEKKDENKKEEDKKEEDKKDQNPDQKDKDKSAEDKQQGQKKSQDNQDKQDPDKKDSSDKGNQDSQTPEPRPESSSAAEDQKNESKDEEKVSKAEAEKLLRMMPDDLGKFYRPPSMPVKRNDSKRDW